MLINLLVAITIDPLFVYQPNFERWIKVNFTRNFGCKILPKRLKRQLANDLWYSRRKLKRKNVDRNDSSSKEERTIKPG